MLLKNNSSGSSYWCDVSDVFLSLLRGSHILSLEITRFSKHNIFQKEGYKTMIVTSKITFFKQIIQAGFAHVKEKE